MRADYTKSTWWMSSTKYHEQHAHSTSIKFTHLTSVLHLHECVNLICLEHTFRGCVAAVMGIEFRLFTKPVAFFIFIQF